MNEHNHAGYRVNRCRPGYGAYCSLCCGSHNYTMTPDVIDELFRNRGREASMRALKHPEEACAEKLFPDGLQCSHVGMDSSNPGELCCLLYDEDERGAGIESYFHGTCKNFYCQAWDDLTDRQVLYAARLMRDWYYYSLFINNIEAVHEICAMYVNPDDVPPDELDSLKSDLVERFLEEDGK